LLEDSSVVDDGDGLSVDEGASWSIFSHKWEDIVRYRQDIFIPAWAHYQVHTRKWKQDDLTVKDISTYLDPFGRRVVIWFHDESTSYANDWRKNRWVHKTENAVPQPKGEGASLMVADFMSADYGWLCSKNGQESARVLFRAGKAWDWYFTNENIVVHAAKAMEILEKNYPDEHHVLVFNNATTRLKRADDALSAQKMPKCPSATWGVSITKKGNDGRPVIGMDGKPVKEKIRMKDAQLPNGDIQHLYFPDGHDKAGYFWAWLHKCTSSPCWVLRIQMSWWKIWLLLPAADVYSGWFCKCGV
jgi:hypothetical protein